MLQACANSKAVVSRGIDLSKYSYVVFGQESTGNSGLDDMIIAVQNEIADTELEVVSAQNGRVKMSLGESVLSPNIHILSENHDGGHTYITITFYDKPKNCSRKKQWHRYVNISRSKYSA